MKSSNLKKLQINHRIDDGLQHENPWETILTSIEFIQENSPNIQRLIKKLNDLIYERKVSIKAPAANEPIIGTPIQLLQRLAKQQKFNYYAINLLTPLN